MAVAVEVLPMMIRSRRVCVAAIAVLLALGAPLVPSAANIFSSEQIDPRQYVSQSGPDWRLLLPVGTIESKFAMEDARGFPTVNPGLGTVFIVSPCYAITNYHVVFGAGHAAPDPMKEYPVMLKFGYRADKHPSEFTRGQARLWGSLGQNSADVALVKMDRCLGLKLGWYDIAEQDGDTNSGRRAVSMPSFSQDRSMEQLSVQRGCEIRWSSPRSPWIEHDCATREGASGAPLLVSTSSVPEVIGLNAGETRPVTAIQPRYDPGLANLGVSSQSLKRLPRISAAIGNNIASARTRNPLATMNRW